MAEMLSPGVFTTEIDASTIAPSVSNSIAVYCGAFDVGPTGTYSLITTVDELISTYGPVTDTNYQDWYQCYNFLQYGNKLYVARAVGESALCAQAEDGAGVDLTGEETPVGNLEAFENEQFNPVGSDSTVRFIARNPGEWGNKLEIAIARPEEFGDTANTELFKGVFANELFEYVPDADAKEVGIVVSFDGKVQEIFTVSTDKDARDAATGKSNYIEDVINNQSSLIYVAHKFGTDITEPRVFKTGGVETPSSELPIRLDGGANSDLMADNIMGAITDCYEYWDNKEAVDIDIVIGNERDQGAGAFKLCNTRKDCIGFIGAEKDQCVGKKSAAAVESLVAARKATSSNFSSTSMFLVACANYKYQYDRFSDKNRWINIAADIAGLRAATSTNRASWFASAGLERGQIKNVKKLAFNPTQAHRDILYKNGLNPICTFPGQGTVMWGQKTLQSKPSSFDRVNVRGLFNTIERSLGKMAKYQVMEFNDNFTRNRIVSMIKPFLGSVQAGRGIQDFLVVCDTSNNTPDVISRNQLVVDVYIKPTYVAEFIHLKFTNAGTNSFSDVIGG